MLRLYSGHTMNIHIDKNADDLAAHVAALIIAAAREAISARGRFTIALAGGKTPKAAYALLAQPDRAGQMDWKNTFVFFGDERFGAMTGRTATTAWPARRSSTTCLFRRETSSRCRRRATRTRTRRRSKYIQTLADFFGVPPRGLPPRLDLILLGLGDDGHTASLFPGAPTLAITDAWVAATPPGTLPPPVDRLTFTFPIINAARQVAFVVSGEAKAGIVQEVLEGGKSRDVHPAVGVQPTDGELLWLLDEAAASRLEKRQELKDRHHRVAPTCRV